MMLDDVLELCPVMLLLIFCKFTYFLDNTQICRVSHAAEIFFIYFAGFDSQYTQR